jgi:hypothetical protein
MPEIPLSHGKTALVDECDYQSVSELKWYAKKCSGRWYAVTVDKKKPRGSGRRYIYLHRYLVPGSKLTDHRDRNTLDCRRSNLRKATHAQNQWNQGIQRNNSSGFIGVYHRKSGRRIKRWFSSIESNGVIKSLGYFSTKIEAATARDDAAMTERGEFAVLNFPFIYG